MNPNPPDVDPADEVNPEEISDAAEDVVTPDVAPEVPRGAEEMVAWDEAPAASGHAVATVAPEDEIPPGEILVREGVEEADREQRMAAADRAVADE